MGWLVGLRDAFFRTSQGAGVTPDGALRVTMMPRHVSDLTREQLVRRRYFSALLQNGGSPDMNVDGSVTPVEFEVVPQDDTVSSVREMRFEFHSDRLNMDTNDVRRFGTAAGLGGLTNGLDIEFRQSGVTTSLTTSPIQTMSQFFTHVSIPPFNVVDGIAVGVDLLVWVIDLKLLLPIPISDANTDQVMVRVKDDLTALNFFRVTVIGQSENVKRDPIP